MSYEIPVWLKFRRVLFRFQAEDGIRDHCVTGVQTCALPIYQVFQEKPIAIFSASQGPMGGARVQYDARRILGQLWAHVLPRPEVFIGAAQTKEIGRASCRERV